MDKSSQNQNTNAAFHSHERPKPREESLRANVHFLDGQNKPLPYKIYRGVESVPLSRDPKVLDGRSHTTLEAISMPASTVSGANEAENIPDLATLSQVLLLAAGITKQKRFPGGKG